MLPLPHGRVLLAIGWGLVILVVLGSLSPGDLPITVSISDKLQHFAGYFLLMFWFSGLYPRNRHWILALGFLLMGAALELLQGWLTQTRMMDWFDFLANAAGIATAYTLAGFGLANWARRVEAWWTRR